MCFPRKKSMLASVCILERTLTECSLHKFVQLLFVKNIKSACNMWCYYHIISACSAGFTAILFPNKQQTAFSANRFFYSSGLMSGFFLPLVVSLRVHLWLMVAQVVVSVITYSILILKTSSRDQLLPCLAHKSRTLTVKTEDGWKIACQICSVIIVQIS